MKIITFYTDTHVVLYDRFVETLKVTNPNLELHSYKTDQISKSGEYSSEGFNATMVDKLDSILKTIPLMEENEYFLYADCDIQFFDDMEKDLKPYMDSNDYDMLFQDDIIRYCAGFFLCKNNEKTRQFFEMIKGEIKNYLDDQEAMNAYIRRGHNGMKFGKLPRNKYFTVAAANGGKRWNGKDFEVPSNVIIHHANWVVGVDTKIKLMDYVKENRN